jgi:ribosome-associated translation inhibitor RaiA
MRRNASPVTGHQRTEQQAAGICVLKPVQGARAREACPLLNTASERHKGGDMKVVIESRNVGMTPRWKKEIEARMGDLERGYEDLIHGRVTLTKNPHHKKSSNVAEALIVVSLPGRHTFTARKEDKTFEEAIRKAFQAVSIELRKLREKRGKKQIRNVRSKQQPEQALTVPGALLSKTKIERP